MLRLPFVAFWIGVSTASRVRRGAADWAAGILRPPQARIAVSRFPHASSLQMIERGELRRPVVRDQVGAALERMALQDSAAQRQVQGMLQNPAVRDQVEAVVERIGHDPALRATMTEMSSDPRMQQYVQNQLETEKILADYQARLKKDPEFLALEEDHKKFLAYVKKKNEEAHAEPEFQSLAASSKKFLKLAKLDKEVSEEPEFAALREKHLRFEELLGKRNYFLEMDAEYQELWKGDAKFQECIKKNSAKLAREPKLLALQESTAKLLEDKNFAAKISKLIAGDKQPQSSAVG